MVEERKKGETGQEKGTSNEGANRNKQTAGRGTKRGRK